MSGKYERLVKARRIAAFAFLAGVTVTIVGAVAALAMPNGAHQVQGVVVEASRDVNGVPSAPVAYSFNGTDHTELVSKVTVVAGEQVTFSVTETGMPASGSWVDVTFFAALALAVMTLVTFFFAITTEDRYEENLRRARGRDWKGSPRTPVHPGHHSRNYRESGAYTYID